MRYPGIAKVILEGCRHVVTLPQHHGQKHRVIRLWQAGTNLRGKLLPPLLQRAPHVETSRAVLDVETARIAHPAHGVDPLPLHKSPKVKTPWILQASHAVEPQGVDAHHIARQERQRIRLHTEADEASDWLPCVLLTLHTV
jgi:hypothetical protein